jgi:hypothetical protein
MNDLILIAILTLLIGIAAGWVSLYLVGRWWRGLWLRRQMGDARIAEEEAGQLLEAKGFKVIGRQKRAEVITYVDGKPHIGYVQADFIATRRDKVYVAEVKTGSYAPDITEPSTRRQLLEYDFVYKPDGILLVDMTERRIHLIEFGLPERQRTEKFALVVAGLMIISILAGLLFLFIQVKLF